jgi:hypothetical protein
MTTFMGRVAYIAVSAAVVGLLVSNHFLRERNEELVSAVANLRQDKGPPIGMQMTLIPGRDLDDRPVMIDNSDRAGPHLVLVFSQSCGFTPKNWPHWRRILAHVPENRVLMVSTTDDATRDYLVEQGIPAGTETIRIDGLARLQYDLRITPATLVLSPGGRLEGVWLGVLNDQKAREVLELMTALGKKPSEEDPI